MAGRALERRRPGLTDLIRCEGLQGIRDHGEFARVRADRLRFHVFQTGGANWLLLPLKTTGTCASRATPSARRSIA